MIAAHELRIGNWVLAPKAIALERCPTAECNDLIEYRIVFIGENFSHGDWFSPLPLTPEILEKCGFEKSLSLDERESDIYSIQVANNNSLYLDNTEWYISHEWNNNHFKNDFWNKPESLHQLQNLYFALTGTELNYSPELLKPTNA